MSQVVEKFEKDYTVTNSVGVKTECRTSLQVMKWGPARKNLVAYTFNSYNEPFCELLAEALKKYKVLDFETGVSGETMHGIICANVRSTLKKILGEHLDVKSDGRRYYTMTLSYID